MNSRRRITNSDERQASPASMAALMGWPRPGGQEGWSWALLMEMAHRMYEQNRARKNRGEAA